MKKILTLLAASSMLVFGGYSAKAQNGALNIFHPVSGWAVGSNGSASAANCAMSAEYNNGFIVQIEGQQGQPQSMSLDLRQNVFSNGQNVTMTLSVPGVGTWPVNGNAFNSQVVAIDLSLYPAIFDGVLQASAFDINLEGSSFRFYTTGMANALPQFDQCMSPVPPLNISEVTPDVMSPMPITETPIQADMAPQPINAYDSVPEENIEIDSGKDDTNKQDLLEELEDFVNNDPVTPAPVSAKTKTIDDKRVQDNFSEWQDDDQAPIIAPPVKSSYSTPEIKVTKDVYQGEADFTKFDMPAEEIDRPAAMPPMGGAEMRELMAEIAELKRENRALNEELEMSLRAGEQERIEVSSDNWNLEKATMQYNEAERQLDSLGRQIQKERAQCAYEKKELEMMLFDPQLTEQSQLAHLASLEEKLAEAKAQLEEQEKGCQAQMMSLRSRNTQ